MIKNKYIIILVLFTFVIFLSCNSEIKTNSKTESHKNVDEEKFSEGIVNYKFELDIPSNEDDGLFVKIIHGAIESLIDKVNPSFSLHYKEMKAKLDFDNIKIFDSEIKIDSLNSGIKLFDFEAGNEISFESDSSTRIARIEKIQDVKYNVVYTDKTKDILNFNCKQAFLIDKSDNDTTVIWYTPEINIPLSPFEYTGIEGLALELSLSGINIFAVSIIEQSQPDSLFVIPNNFEKIFE